MIPIFASLGLLMIAQITASTPSERLSQAELKHNRPALVTSLTQLTDTLALAPTATLSSAVPALIQALADDDPHIRSLALLALTTLTTRTLPDGSLSKDAIFLLEPFLPVFSKHLTDSDPAVRELTALFLGGLPSELASAVILPLISTLETTKRPGPGNLSIIVALLSVDGDSAVHPEVAAAIFSFLCRPDLTNDLAARFIGAIANHPHHSMLLDAALISILEPPHATDLKVALILALPHLALSQSSMEATRARLESILADSSEDPAVKVVAGEVLPCWHKPRMSLPCPTPSVHYRMIPAPEPPAPSSPPLS